MRFSLELDFPPAPVQRRTEERHKVPHPFMGVFGRNTPAGVGIDEEGALSLSAVYAAVNKIASTLASLPLNLYRETVDGKNLAKEHPAFVLLNSEPNENDTSFTFVERMLSDALMYGCAYALIERGSVTARAAALHPSTRSPSSGHHEGQRIFRTRTRATSTTPTTLSCLSVSVANHPSVST